MPLNGKKVFYKKNEILDEKKCPFCKKVGCYGDCRKEKILSKLDDKQYKIDPLKDKGLFLDPLEKVDYKHHIEKVDYKHHIEKEKSKLLSLLSGILLDSTSIDASSFLLLGYKIMQIGGTIERYEDLSKGFDLFKEVKIFKEIEKIIDNYPTEKDSQLPTLEEVNRDLKINTTGIVAIIETLINSMKVASGKEIKKAGEKLIELSNEILKLKSMKKTLKVIG